MSESFGRYQVRDLCDLPEHQRVAGDLSFLEAASFAAALNTGAIDTHQIAWDDAGYFQAKAPSIGQFCIVDTQP